MQPGITSNRNPWLCPILLLAVLLSTGVSPPKKSPPIPTFRDEDGKIIRLEALMEKRDVLALIFVSSKCPVTNLYWERIKGIWYNYRKRNVAMYLVGGNSDETAPDIHAILQERDLELPLVWDNGHVLARAFGIHFTPEALVLGKNLEILYRGRIDDSWRDESRIQKRHLEDALSAALEGKKSPDHADDPFMGSRLR